ncbi:hypothetical protein [Sphingobacterium yanglingense]|uniref:Uncharacterized protein n=1 Tax=Sphingobacterium yanglingense TaxID=1437280 RepID=A0A4R6W8F4_9SPHI|nr:hypothetical protein [Sphingobacterium yanglingense]TDQ73831.1 hypothetical protein CLV99_4268 [Sphingobacterium yanglingense]
MNREAITGLLTLINNTEELNFLPSNWSGEKFQHKKTIKKLKKYYLYFKIQKAINDLTTGISVPINEGDRDRVKVNLSVDQIAIMLRSLVEADVFDDPNLSKIARRFASFLSSSKTDKISTESLRSKFYNVETKDKEIVLETLRKMIASIKSM